MAIKMVSKTVVEQNKLDAARRKLEMIEEEMVVHIKEAINALVDIDHIYMIRDFIDDKIVNWVDEVVELDENFLDDDDNEGDD